MIEEENKNAYEEAVDKWCAAIEEREDDTACRNYLETITYILLMVHEKELKGRRP